MGEKHGLSTEMGPEPRALSRWARSRCVLRWDRPGLSLAQGWSTTRHMGPTLISPPLPQHELETHLSPQRCWLGGLRRMVILVGVYLTSVVQCLKHLRIGPSLVVHWLRHCSPNAGGPGSIPGQGTRFHKLQLRVRMPQLKIPHTANKICERVYSVAQLYLTLFNSFQSLVGL